MSVGERIKFYRRRRGLTQEVLANLVGRKVDWLSKIERGERDVRRLDVVSDVARALRVTVADLFGQPVLMEDDEDHDDIPAVRDALMSPRRLSRTLFGTAAPPVNVHPAASAHCVQQAWDGYQSGRLGRWPERARGGLPTRQRRARSAAHVGAAHRRAAQRRCSPRLRRTCLAAARAEAGPARQGSAVACALAGGQRRVRERSRPRVNLPGQFVRVMIPPRRSTGVTPR